VAEEMEKCWRRVHEVLATRSGWADAWERKVGPVSSANFRPHLHHNPEWKQRRPVHSDLFSSRSGSWQTLFRLSEFGSKCLRQSPLEQHGGSDVFVYALLFTVYQHRQVMISRTDHHSNHSTAHVRRPHRHNHKLRFFPRATLISQVYAE
jgi:hypothetical protein